ncbi:MAG: asparagine--tRNA ligase [Nitrospira sp.]|uniref:Asparagine--tRNA ligase n=1 Tax=Nitrospira defluvii TaxID=330214 RepID=A0ABM8QHR8_9BACT|nr:asparagine--tRNA ligase [Nitrospira defluvii]MCS6329044.1 asparagine--tRNA ligase [Nitrospira sp.]CAE6698013.1 Asparagine--tRNA ligase [Nitrospira defluvii]
MPVIYIEEASAHAGQAVTIRGWLRSRRDKGKLHFLILRDGTGEIQAVVSKGTVGEEQFARSAELTQESSVVVSGTLRQDARAPGGYELDVSGLEVLQVAEPFPIQPKEHGTGFLMEHRHLWLRSSRQHAVLRIRHEIIRACRNFFDDRGFTLVDAPIFTPNACEGTTTLFHTQYFDETAYLTQSGQLYSEATAAAFGKVYCFGPTFRAEKSKTRRHLMEFWMVEPEVAFAQLADMMELAEQFLAHIVEAVLRTRRAELKLLERDVAKLERVTAPFPRITYEEAIDTLQRKGLPAKSGDDFGADDETILSKEFDRPVIVHRYPAALKAFYMETDPQRPDLALCMDVLAPEGYGEIIGGGQRVDSHEKLLARLHEHHLPVDAFQWYLDLRRYGSVPHAGFGMGIERAVAWICGLEHVRETIPFPRMLYRLYP